MQYKFQRELEFSRLAAKNYVGTARADISSLDFIKSRQPDHRRVAYLKDIFRRTKIRRYDPENIIPVLITSWELDKALNASGLERSQLTKPTQDGELPFLKAGTGQVFFCLRGKHRTIAAESYLEREDRWWSIRLFLVNSSDDREILETQWRDDFAHQVSFSDGEIFRKLREYEKSGDRSQADIWMARLSPCKRTGYSQLIKHYTFTKAFDTLLPFPGLWVGLELGNIQRHLALKCDEQFLVYASHIRETWITLTLGENSGLAKFVDIQTVEAVQLRAPATIKADRDFVVHAMDTGLLYPTVIETDIRKQLLKALLETRCLIPSIKSLHENLKHLEIGSKILKEVVLGRIVRTTLESTLKTCWVERRSTFIETGPGLTQSVTTQSINTCWNVVHRQLWINSLRNFADLGGRAPRKEKGDSLYKAKLDITQRYLYAKFARDLGFETEAILDCLVNDPRRKALRASMMDVFHLVPSAVDQIVEQLLEQHPLKDVAVSDEAEVESREDGDLEDLGRRCGVPFQRAYTIGKRVMFYQNMTGTRHDDPDEMPSVAFLQHDFMTSFFGHAPEITVEMTADIGDDDNDEDEAKMDYFFASVSDADQEDFNSGDTDEGLWPNPDSISGEPSLSTSYSNHTAPTMDPPSQTDVPPHNDLNLQETKSSWIDTSYVQHTEVKPQGETSTQAATSQVDSRVVSTVDFNQPLDSREDLAQPQAQDVPPQRQESLSFISLPSDEPRSGIASMLSSDIELGRLISYKPPPLLDQSTDDPQTDGSSLAQTSNQLQLYDPSLEGDSWAASVSQEQQMVRYEQLRAGSIEEQQVVRYERPIVGSVQEQQLVRYELSPEDSVHAQGSSARESLVSTFQGQQQLVLYEPSREDVIEEQISLNLRPSSTVSKYPELQLVRYGPLSDTSEGEGFTSTSMSAPRQQQLINILSLTTEQARSPINLLSFEEERLLSEGLLPGSQRGNTDETRGSLVELQEQTSLQQSLEPLVVVRGASTLSIPSDQARSPVAPQAEVDLYQHDDSSTNTKRPSGVEPSVSINLEDPTNSSISSTFSLTADQQDKITAMLAMVPARAPAAPQVGEETWRRQEVPPPIQSSTKVGQKPMNKSNGTAAKSSRKMPRSPIFTFFEWNGMKVKEKKKSREEMEAHLKARRGWVMFQKYNYRRGVTWRVVRGTQVIPLMSKNPLETYALVIRDYTRLWPQKASQTIDNHMKGNLASPSSKTTHAKQEKPDNDSRDPGFIQVATCEPQWTMVECESYCISIAKSLAGSKTCILRYESPQVRTIHAFDAKNASNIEHLRVEFENYHWAPATDKGLGMPVNVDKVSSLVSLFPIWLVLEDQYPVLYSLRRPRKPSPPKRKKVAPGISFPISNEEPSPPDIGGSRRSEELFADDAPNTPRVIWGVKIDPIDTTVQLQDQKNMAAFTEGRDVIFKAGTQLEEVQSTMNENNALPFTGLEPSWEKARPLEASRKRSLPSDNDTEVIRAQILTEERSTKRQKLKDIDAERSRLAELSKAALLKEPIIEYFGPEGSKAGLMVDGHWPKSMLDENGRLKATKNRAKEKEAGMRLKLE